MSIHLDDVKAVVASGASPDDSPSPTVLHRPKPLATILLIFLLAGASSASAQSTPALTAATLIAEEVESPSSTRDETSLDSAKMETTTAETTRGSTLGCPADALFVQGPRPPAFPGATVSDTDFNLVGSMGGVRVWEAFTADAGRIGGIRWWGLKAFRTSVTQFFVPCFEPTMDFVITFHEDMNGMPGDVVCTYNAILPGLRTGVPIINFEINQFELDLDITPGGPCDLKSGWISIQSGGDDPTCWFMWVNSITDAVPGRGAWFDLSDGNGLQLLGGNLSLCLTPTDCNGNEIMDETDIADGTSKDCNQNSIPDECDADCNSNNVPDQCDVDPADPDNNHLVSKDCNADGVPDECAGLFSLVYEMRVDNLVDLSADCGLGSFHNGCSSSAKPGFTWVDEGLGVATAVRIEFNIGVECHTVGTVHDTSLNGAAGESFVATPRYCTCDLTLGVRMSIVADPAGYHVGDANTFLITNPTNCFGFTPQAEWGRGIYGRISVDYKGPDGDCNHNGRLDECELADGTSADCDINGTLDECELCGDLDGDGAVDRIDLT